MSPPRPPEGPDPDPEDALRLVGLCLTCAHVKTLETGRSTFYQCLRAAADPRFARYPALPVRWCPGHEATNPDPSPIT